MLQLKHGRHCPALRTPNTLSALSALAEAEILSPDDFAFFTASYRFLRTLEGRLRLMNFTARNQLPDDSTELAKLAQLLRSPSPQDLLSQFDHYTRETRLRFDRLFDAENA